MVVFHVLTTFILMENILASRYWLNRGVSWNIDLGNDLTFNKCKYNIRFERQWCNIMHAHSFAIDFIYEGSRRYPIQLFRFVSSNYVVVGVIIWCLIFWIIFHGIRYQSTILTLNYVWMGDMIIMQRLAC